MGPHLPIVPQPALEDSTAFVAIPTCLARHAARFPDQPAVKCDGVVRSWKAFDRRLNKIAHSLAGMGLGRGDKIAVLATRTTTISANDRRVRTDLPSTGVMGAMVYRMSLENLGVRVVARPDAPDPPAQAFCKVGDASSGLGRVR